jgi:Ser/Thr protein kinase RdoA (MazF antagonist)
MAMTGFDSGLVERLTGQLHDTIWQWQMPPDATVMLLNLSENATFKVESNEQTLILRVHRQGYHTENEIRSEHRWIEALVEEGLVQTPMPIRNRSGDTLTALPVPSKINPMLVSAFAFVPGKEPRPDDQHLTGYFERLGGLCARLHRHTESKVFAEGFTRKIWDYEAIIGKRAIWGHWRHAAGLEKEDVLLLTRAQTLIERKLAEYGQARPRFGLIHGDPRLANLLVENDVLWLIDFDDCGFSWFGFDFAASVSFFEHEPHVPDLMDHWVTGYRCERPWTRDDEAILPVLVLMRRMQLLGWAASHAEAPTAQAMGAQYSKGALLMAERFLSTGTTPFR